MLTWWSKVWEQRNWVGTPSNHSHMSINSHPKGRPSSVSRPSPPFLQSRSPSSTTTPQRVPYLSFPPSHSNPHQKATPPTLAPHPTLHPTCPPHRPSRQERPTVRLGPGLAPLPSVPKPAPARRSDLVHALVQSHLSLLFEAAQNRISHSEKAGQVCQDSRDMVDVWGVKCLSGLGVGSWSLSSAGTVGVDMGGVLPEQGCVRVRRFEV